MNNFDIEHDDFFSEECNSFSENSEQHYDPELVDLFDKKLIQLEKMVEKVTDLLVNLKAEHKRLKSSGGTANV